MRLDQVIVSDEVDNMRVGGKNNYRSIGSYQFIFFILMRLQAICKLARPIVFGGVIPPSVSVDDVNTGQYGPLTPSAA